MVAEADEVDGDHVEQDDSLLNETLPPLDGAADLSDDGPDDDSEVNEANEAPPDASDTPPDSPPDSQPSPPDAPPEPQESPAVASATLGTLKAIAEAETLCANAEEAVEEAKAVLKEARAEYDGCVANLRKLAKALRNDQDRPLFDGLEGDRGTAPSATDPATPSDSNPINTDSDADLHYDNLLAQPLFVLDLPKGIRETLKKAGVETVGDLETLREDIMFDRKKWPRGIGPAKIDVIEDAVIEWLAQNDHDVVPSDVDGEDDNDETEVNDDGEEDDE